MFIEEQKTRSIYDLQPGFHSDPGHIERHVWSPVSCRFTSWRYSSLVRSTESGRIVPRSRVRCPFIVGTTQ